MDREVSANRAFSFRHHFADQWYDLHNPDQTATPMTVRFQTRRPDFPPNIERLRIKQVVLYVARVSDSSPEIRFRHLRFGEEGSFGMVGGRAMTRGGIISTRSGNAPTWTPMIGHSPIGEWELSLPDTPQTRQLFRDEQVSDILFVLTYEGDTPPWPK
jgi:hypothetical protein